ncbi:hypothetical protein [Halosimplex pelagicum]|uniref:Uncharacterized protein n=1 Tax=Halosimplex pelagicum TaxID=869886 RepID=A0A7D5P946_9EURY|nr:hypothetical protein [Halosimplex pelagicum]QLH83877.1 hypothetical protein HZS54_20575 [Halosimplex pelagicum]
MVFGYVAYAGVVLLTGVGVLWGIGSLLVGFDRFEEARAIRTTPVASLDSVAVGPAAIRGEVEPVAGPETDIYGCEAAVAYDLTVTDFENSQSTTPVDRSRVRTFDVTTDEGSIRVEDAVFDLHVSDERSWTENRESYRTPDEELWRFEREWGLGELSAGEERTYEAEYLCPGDEVYVYGTVEVDDDREGDEGKPLVLTDRDGLAFASDRDPDALLRERRFALAKDGAVGVLVGTVSLAAFLWLTGIAQVFLGA